MTNGLPTVIDGAEVFDSAGTLALQINGIDVLHLEVLPAVDADTGDTMDEPGITDQDLERVHRVILAALGLDPETGRYGDE